MNVLGNYRNSFYEGELNESPSLTQPDQTMSVRDLLKRHLSGMPLTGVDGQFTADDEGYDPFEFTDDIHDPTELENLASIHSANMDLLNSRLTDEKKLYKERLEKEAKEKDEQLFAAYKTRLQRENATKVE